MKKWFFAGGLVGVAGLVLVMGALAIGVFAQSTAPPEPLQAPLTLEEAKAVVEAAYPGATVIEAEKDDGGLAAYEVELDSGLEVKVDMNTGEILGTEQDGANEAADTDGASEADGTDDTDGPDNAEDADGPGDTDDVNEADDADDAQEAPETEKGTGQ